MPHLGIRATEEKALRVKELSLKIQKESGKVVSLQRLYDIGTDLLMQTSDEGLQCGYCGAVTSTRFECGILQTYVSSIPSVGTDDSGRTVILTASRVVSPELRKLLERLIALCSSFPESETLMTDGLGGLLSMLERPPTR